MHLVQGLLSGIYPSKDNLPPLTVANASRLQSALTADRDGLFYSSLVSLGHAIQCLRHRGQTWGVVQAYYSLFYSTRGLLAHHSTGLFYIQSKPYSITATAGEIPRKLNGTSHAAALGLFKLKLPSSVLLSQPIGTTDPFDWLQRLREEANYSACRFPDPSWETSFKAFIRGDLRLLISAYINDTSYLYSFDPDHAVIAFPLKALQLLSQHISADSLSEDEVAFVRSLWADRKGPFSDTLASLGVG